MLEDVDRCMIADVSEASLGEGELNKQHKEKYWSNLNVFVI